MIVEGARVLIVGRRIGFSSPLQTEEVKIGEL